MAWYMLYILKHICFCLTTTLTNRSYSYWVGTEDRSRYEKEYAKAFANEQNRSRWEGFCDWAYGIRDFQCEQKLWVISYADLTLWIPSIRIICSRRDRQNPIINQVYPNPPICLGWTYLSNCPGALTKGPPCIAFVTSSMPAMLLPYAASATNPHIVSAQNKMMSDAVYTDNFKPWICCRFGDDDPDVDHLQTPNTSWSIL